MSGMRFTVELSPQNSRHYSPAHRKYLEYKVAKIPSVQGEIEKVAKELSAEAKKGLAEHRKSGASKIVVSKGSVDRQVILTDSSDADGDKSHAAYMIELETGALAGAMLHAMGSAAKLSQKRGRK